MTEVQELVARLRLKDEMSGPIRKVRAGISGVSDALNHPRMQKGIAQIGTGLRNAALIGAAGIGILASQIALGLQSLVELEQQEAQTQAVIESTGGIAGITAAEVGKLAEKYEDLNAVIGDEVIREAENMLLTFTNIREDAFEPTLEAVLNLNTALGKGPEGLTGTAIIVGKALNDPERGLTALRRVGVSFSKDQEKVIKRLVETGDVLGAQQVILAELEKEFGGSFLAQGSTTAGKVAKVKDSIEDLQRALAEALLPTIGKVADGLSDFFKDPTVIAAVKDLGESIAGLFSDENIKTGADLLKGAISTAKDAAPIIADAAKATFSIVSAAVGLFKSLPPEVQKLAIGAFAINKITGGLVTNVAGGLISAVLKQLVSGVVNVNGAVVNVNGGVGPGGVAGAAKGGLSLASLVPLVAVGAIMVGAAEVLGPHLRELLGVPDTGRGKKVDGTPIVVGQSQAAEAHADDTRKVGGHAKDLVTKAGEQARLSVITNERLESIRGASNTNAHLTVAATERAEALQTATLAQRLAAGDTRSEVATQRLGTQVTTRLSADSQSERSAIDRAAEAARGTTRAVNAKDLSVVVYSQATFSVSGLTGAIQKAKSIYKVAS